MGHHPEAGPRDCARVRHALRVLALVALLLAAPGAGARTLEMGESVVMRAAAVAETPTGFVGSTATFTITTATNGSGHVFLDTFPLTEVDMQGSARLAARVAAQVTGKSLSDHDFFFVVRSGSQTIGGPSAGGTLAVGAIAALNGWRVRSDALMTGTINPDGSIGPVGGIPEKAAAAAETDMALFLYPAGQDEVFTGDGTVVNMTQHCARLGIECRPIADVIDAVGEMTDYAIERRPVQGNVTGDVFLAKLAPLSAQLVAQAEERVREAETESARLTERQGRDTLVQQAAAARETLGRAQQASANGTYYTAASLSFQAAIAAHRVRDTARLFAGDAGALEASLAEAREAVATARRAVDATPVVDTARFESAGAAQDRLLQAEASLAEAEESAAQPGIGAALAAVEAASFAAERASTAVWWLGLGENLPPGESVSEAELASAARDTLTTSEELIAYAAAVLRDVGTAPLANARDRLAAAQLAEERGYHAGAMLMALEAEVRASAILQIAGFGGRLPDEKLESARLAAARAIQEARERGAEPLLAQSVYEFSFAQEDDVERLSYLGMARVSANLAGLPGLFAPVQPAQSRFQGIPEVPGIPASWVAASFAVGIAMGAGVGLAALAPRDDEE